MREHLLAGAALAALLLAGCSEEKDKRGLEALPDMHHTPAYKSQNVIERRAADGVHHAPVMAAPVAGTVPRGSSVYPFAMAEFEAAKDLLNPLAADAATLKAGQRAYRISCSVCHGLDGNAAHTSMAKSFSGIPSVNGTNIKVLSDGEIYHFITTGKNGRMPAMRAQVLPEQRWAIAHYLRALSRATLAAQEAAAVVTAAEGELRPVDSTMPLRTKLLGFRSILEQREADLKALTTAGEGDEFIPPPQPVPEYVPVEWPNPKPAGGPAHGGH